MQETIHTRIRESRIEAGLSQAKVGRALRISREAVGQWEKVAPGKKLTIPKKEHLEEFGKLVNRNPEWLKTGKGPKEYPQPSTKTAHFPDANYGWICPICGRVNAPSMQSCPYPHEKN